MKGLRIWNPILFIDAQAMGTEVSHLLSINSFSFISVERPFPLFKSTLLLSNALLLSIRLLLLCPFKKMPLVESKRVSEQIVDETVLKAGSENIWLWVVTEPVNGQFLAQTISKERNTFVAERFLSDIIKDHGKSSFYRDGGT